MIVFWLFLGWFIFVMFGGIGLIALPLDMILDYFYRPKPRTAREIAERKVILRRRVEELMNFVDVVKDSLEEFEDKKDEKFIKKLKEKGKHVSKENKLRRELYKLEDEFEIYQVETNLTANPI